MCMDVVNVFSLNFWVLGFNMCCLFLSSGRDLFLSDSIVFFVDDAEVYIFEKYQRRNYSQW